MIVFVYGTLRKGQHNHRLLSDARFLGEARTEPEWTMVSLGKFPGVIPGGETAILGELWEVNDDQLERLDRLEGHPMFYRRRTVALDDGRRVAMYVLTHADRYAEFEPILSGDWKHPTYAASGPWERR